MGYARLVSFCQLRLMSHDLPGNFPHQHVLGAPLASLGAGTEPCSWLASSTLCLRASSQSQAWMFSNHSCCLQQSTQTLPWRGAMLQSSSMTSFVEAACEHVQTQARSSCVKNPEARVSSCDCGYHA